MRTYELYLDESGKFINEENAKSPSLIGGILLRKDDLSLEKSNYIMKNIKDRLDKSTEYVHMNDLVKQDKKLAGRIQVETLQDIKSIPAHIVIFENNELLDFKDDKLLYLNMMAEGIVNLFEKLSLEKSDPVELNVVAAVRRNLEYDDGTILEKEEYSNRINERIYLKLAKKDIFLTKTSKINFSLSSARKNPKLMLADVVCNTRLTRNSSKFTNEEKEIINNIYSSSKYIFNVFRDDIQKKISDYSIQNNIVDALFLIEEIDNSKKKNEVIQLIINNINTMPITNLKIQLELLSLKIKTLIDVHRNLLLCEKLLDTIQDKIINKIKVKDYIISKLKLDISLYLLSIYTHQGNSNKCYEQIKICNNNLGELSGSFEFIEYYNVLKIREAIYYMNNLDNNKAIDILTVLFNNFNKILASLSEINEYSVDKSDLLAKITGTRLQAYTNLITKDLDNDKKKELYKLALNDSDYAIKHFVSKSDIKRQYQYRSMLELAVENYNDSLKYLMKCANIDGINYDKFLEYVYNMQSFNKQFLMNNYFQIMAVSNNKDMYISYTNSNIYNDYVIYSEEDDTLYSNKSENKNIHPFEMIYWNIGKYYMNNNKDYALNYFNKAIEICNSINEASFKVLELAIELDKLSISNNVIKDRENVINKYNNIINNTNFEIVNNYFKTLEDKFIFISTSNDQVEIKKVCRYISNKIKL